MTVFVLVCVCVIPHTANLPKSILPPQVAVNRKHNILKPWKPANKPGQRMQILQDLKSLDNKTTAMQTYTLSDQLTVLGSLLSN